MYYGQLLKLQSYTVQCTHYNAVCTAVLHYVLLPPVSEWE